MIFDDAVRLCEILMAWAFIVQCLEHITQPQRQSDLYLFIPRLILSVVLMMGIAPAWVCLGLFFTSIVALHRYQGPYNGGSDRIGILILFCLCLVHWLPVDQWKELAFGYLALQVILSYFISGWVKVVNPEWRNGQALQDVFLFSAYPRFENLRALSQCPTFLLWASWIVIIFELLFPISFLSQTGLIMFLAMAAIFHLSNFFFFGLNRFFWIWIASYPSLLWLQDRII